VSLWHFDMETIAELIDKLITANVKVWHYVEAEGAEAHEKMKQADMQRHQLMNELDQRLGEKNVHKGLKTWKNGKKD